MNSEDEKESLSKDDVLQCVSGDREGIAKAGNGEIKILGEVKNNKHSLFYIVTYSPNLALIKI